MSLCSCNSSVGLLLRTLQMADPQRDTEGSFVSFLLLQGWAFITFMTAWVTQYQYDGTNLLVLLTYVLQVGVLVWTIPPLMVSAEMLFAPRGTRHDKTKRRSGKKLRFPHIPFHNRRKRIRDYLRRLDRRRRENDFVEPDFDEEWRDYERDRYRHGWSYAEHFDDTCSRFKDFITLFGADPGLCARKRRRVVRRFGFHAEEGAPNNGANELDLTALTEDDDTLFRFQALYLNSDRDGTPLVFDSGATITVTPFKSDFVSWDSSSEGMRLNGIEGSSVVKGVGTVRFHVRTDSGASYHRNYRLLCASGTHPAPQHSALHAAGGWIVFLPVR